MSCDQLEQIQHSESSDIMEPLEPSDIIESLEPSEIMQTLEPLEPLEPSDIIESLEPSEKIMQTLEPLEPLEPSDIIESLEPSEIMQPLEPSEIVQPLKPSDITESLEPSEIMQPLEPSDITESLEPSEIVQPLKPSDITESLEPSEIMQPLEPSEIVQPLEPSEIMQPLESSKIMQPLESSEIVQPLKPSDITESLEPSEIMQPLEPSEIVQPLEPSEIMQTLEPNIIIKETKKYDVILKTSDGNEIYANKSDLISASEYFEKMFGGGFQESTQDVIEIKDISIDVLKCLIDFIYTKELDTINSDNAEEILNGAEFLQITDARVKCVKFFTENMMNDNNYLMIKDMADFREITELSQNCIEYALSRFEFVSNHPSFLDGMDIELLIQLINDDNLNASHEEDVYTAVMKWVKYDLSGRKYLLPELLSLVRLVFIPTKYLLKEMKKEPLIYSNPECLKHFNRVIDHYNFEYGEPLSKIITNVKPRKNTKTFIDKMMDNPNAVFKIPGSIIKKDTINLFSYLNCDENPYSSAIRTAEWDAGMNELNFTTRWYDDWQGLFSADDISRDED